MKKSIQVHAALETVDKTPRAVYVVPALERQGLWSYATGSGGVIFPIQTGFFRPLDKASSGTR